MFRNYLAAALRNLARNRLYAGINIVGLAVGFAAAILIALFVRDELTYDRWIPGYERTYRVTNVLADWRGQALHERSDTYRGVAEWMKLDFPQIETVARLGCGNEIKLRHGDVDGIETVDCWADPDIFSVLPLIAIAGDLKTALQRPDGIVMTRRMARKYFGRDTPIGETIEIDREHLLTVTAVIENLPSDTHLEMEILMSGRASFSALTTLDTAQFGSDREPWSMLEAITYLRLAPGASIDELRRALPAFVERHELRQLLGDIEIRIHPIASLHLLKGVPIGSRPPGDIGTIYAFAGIAVLILLVASINFVNLMTARAGRRAVEVGIRKVSGAARRHLMIQFVGESLIYVALGAVLAVAAVEWLLPVFNGFLGRTIVLDYWRNPVLAGAIGGLVLTVGIFGGFYPAFVLSAFQPVGVLKGDTIRSAGSAIVRQALVVLQFAILIGLILATVVIYRQTQFAMNDNLRVEKDQLLTVHHACIPAMKDELLKLPGIREAACTWNGVDGGGYPVSATIAGGVTLSGVYTSPVDFGYLETLDLKPLAGRFATRDRGGDSVSPDATSRTNPTVVINETAMHRLGFGSPEAAIGQTVQWKRMLVSRQMMESALPSEIIGVVRDFAVSIRTPIRPIFYYADASMSEATGNIYYTRPQSLVVRLSGHDIPEALAGIDRLWRQLGEQGRPIERSFLNQQLQEFYLDITRQGKMFAAFAGIAVFIACLGLFGLSAFTAERRTKEIGIRKAMGATRWDIVRLLVWQFLKPVLLANLIAWPVGWFFMDRWLRGFAYHVDLSPWIFVASGTAALGIALVTVSAHAFLVARAKPVAALRYE